MKIYQGQYLVAALVDGRLERNKGIELQISLHRLAHNGLRRIWKEIAYPKIEEPREYENFQFIAFANVFVALANSISEEGHGGALIVIPTTNRIATRELKIKYRQESTQLRSAFISYMNARHRIADIVTRIEAGNDNLKGEYAIAEVELIAAHTPLVEAIRFVARLSGCDGAILITEDLRVLGFGTEIRSGIDPKTKVREMTDEMRGRYKPLNIEQFCQRHRSAISLVSRKPKFSVLVVSQDGPISFIWSERKRIVNLRKSPNLVNLNMPWA
jgi:hypothetical protein